MVSANKVSGRGTEVVDGRLRQKEPDWPCYGTWYDDETGNIQDQTPPPEESAEGDSDEDNN